MDRRVFLMGATAFATLAGSPAFRALTANAAESGDDSSIGIGPGPFDSDVPIRIARTLAERPPREPSAPFPKSLTDDLDYSTYQAIRFRNDHALWKDEGQFRVGLFHGGFFFHHPIRMFEVRQGQAREVPFSVGDFEYPDAALRDSVAKVENGIAGFRLLYAADWERDFLAFLGASYFRAVGGTKQFGGSARGLAIDTTSFGKEEFPRFSAFWLERPAVGDYRLVVHALLESASATGAYRFEIIPGGSTTMDVRATLFTRRHIEDAGIAPLTSMFLFGENDRYRSDDFRPEVHDSDGLQILTGAGESIWRPLVNPPRPVQNLHIDSSPRGFGLMQRDRNFDHYQDDGVFYDRRPNMWIEPTHDWGEGSVVLVELPAAEETQDNIVAYWRPKDGLAAGGPHEFRYRLHWTCDDAPIRNRAAAVIASRVGISGIPGQTTERDGRKFVVDFAGGPLSMMTKKSPIVPDITASRGRVANPAVISVNEMGGWRLIFDLLDIKGDSPIELRAFLRLGDRALSETWLYHHWPRR